MKIVCPSCDAQYEVPELVLTSRRKMRCARCGTQWVPADIEAGEAAVPEMATAHVANQPAKPDTSQNIPAADADIAGPDDAKLDFILVEPEPDAQAEIVAPAPEIIEPAPARKLALRPDTPVTVLPELSSPARPGAPRPVVPATAPEGGTPLLAWGGSIAVLVVALAAVVIFRSPVMKAWPPSTRLYTALGLGER